MAWLLRTEKQTHPKAYTYRSPQQQTYEPNKILQWYREQQRKQRQILYLAKKYENKTDQELGKAFRELIKELYGENPNA